jgi:Protein of unknown function (DUF1501)
MSRLCNTITPLLNRRQILQSTSCGFGWLAFSSLAAGWSRASEPEVKGPHFPAKAKRVIFLCMRGAPSHVDTFDYKPLLAKADGKQGPRPGSKFMASPWKFSQSGKSGLWISELFSETAKHADKMCMIHSMQTDLPAHPQAMLRLHTGTNQFIRPSVGSWTLYGLGSENENLPGFISISPPGGGGGSQNYGSAFLPAIYQGTKIGGDNRNMDDAKVPNIEPQVAKNLQRAELDYIQALNKQKLALDRVNPNVDGVIESYELAFRMQSEMPKVMDINQESEATKSLYGLDDQATAAMGKKCLMARRLVEAGVRFVEITHGNWDHHNNLAVELPRNCKAVDKPIAGLLSDLQKRGLLDETLVVWTGEFGRTPYAQGRDGRDHNNKAFTLWMAGGGVKPGFDYGVSGDHGHEATENVVPLVDFHATMLALLGLDHERLTYRYAGRDFRLTDVRGRVVKDVIA